MFALVLSAEEEEKKIVEKEARGLPPGRNSAAAAFTCTTQQGAVKSRDITRAQSSKKIRGGSITIAPRDTNREQKKKTVYGTKD